MDNLSLVLICTTEHCEYCLQDRSFNKAALITETIYFSAGCSIELEDKVILTGGVIDGVDSSTVSIYDNNGWLRDLPNLQYTRRNHGCGHYVNDRNKIVSWLLRRFFGIFIK